MVNGDELYIYNHKGLDYRRIATGCCAIFGRKSRKAEVRSGRCGASKIQLKPNGTTESEWSKRQSPNPQWVIA